MLNSDQEKALNFTKSWWYSDHQVMVIGGRGGCGKSYLGDAIVKTIPNINPLFIAPTNEALKQFRDKITGDYVFKTAHSALGIAPIEDEKELKFEQMSFPKLWEDVNIVLADEASMYHRSIMELLLQTRTKIIFLGHKSQLPPVSKKRSVFDKCLSPVFEEDFPTIELTIPQRNVGKLWEFNNLLEERIYEARPRIVPIDYDISKKDLNEYVTSHGKDAIFYGETKLVLWTNSGVDAYNQRIRNVIFGEQAKTHKYLPGDKIILTKPYVGIDLLEIHSENSLKKLTGTFTKETENYFFSNAKAVVRHCEEKLVRLNTALHIPVYKITVDCEGVITSFYEPVFSQDHERVSKYYEHIAWNAGDKNRKARAFRERSFIRSCFAHVKHFYSATAHRLQGATVENIITILSDIEKNPNPIERAKCLYVACSRAKTNLMIYRGVT
jgi:hypothetical protein